MATNASADTKDEPVEDTEAIEDYPQDPATEGDGNAESGSGE